MRARFLSALALLMAPVPAAAGAEQAPCVVGAYRGPGAAVVVITERANTAETGEWRYGFRDGRYGGTKDGVVTCAGDRVMVAGRAWPRIALKITPTRFRSGDAMLTGMLIEPPAGRTKPPLIVAVHGSENTAAVNRSAYPFLFAAQGVAAFVYDKRGTGASEGRYHQNFHRLAADVVAASAEAKRLAAGRYRRFGLFGGSQGGWVAPRAANDAGAEFVIVGFGLLINPLEEDAQQVAIELREAGYGADVLAKAREVTDATGEVMASHFQGGYEGLAAVKARYGKEPWFGRIKGEFSGEMLAGDEASLRRDGAARHDALDLDWRYDAIGEMRKVRAPQLWVIAGEDREAPPAVTIERLQALRGEGKRIRIVRFPRTDHGMAEFEQAADGTRKMVRITEGYLAMIADWAKGEWHPLYGAGEMLTPD